MFCVTFPD